jgi:hypothetical protein
MYETLAAIGGIIWAIMTTFYAMKFNAPIRERKWYGTIAYIGLAGLVGGLMEVFRPQLESYPSYWTFAGLVIFIYITAKIYIFRNIEY